MLMRIAPVLLLVVFALKNQAPRSAVVILLAAVLELLLIAGVTRRWRAFFLVGFPFLVLGVFYAGYTIMYGSPPGRALALILLPTSADEMLGVLRLPEVRSFSVMLVAGAALYLFLTWRLPRMQSILTGGANRGRAVTLALLVPLTAYVAWNPDQLIDGIAYSPTAGSVLFFAGTVPRANATLHGLDIVKIPYHAQREGGEEVHILVVGESARRESWSVYGYKKHTTPYLEQLKSEAIFLQHVRADANLTTWAVPILLTGIPPEQFTSSAVHGNIVDLAKEAGFSTTWLLNQDITVAMGVGIAADHTVYPPDLKANILDRHTLDETLLAPYRRELGRTGQARFIGIHMMGSHWEYYRRYPPAFARFGKANDLSTLSIFVEHHEIEQRVADAYDNTVLYTDWFLQQVIEPTRKLTVPVTVTFFPDHGEDLQLLDGESGHGAPRFTRHAFDIPAFVWVNDTYRKAYPDKVAALSANADKPIHSRDLFNTLADLMQIRWPGGSSTHSFASAEFTPDANTRVIAGGVLVEPATE